MTFYFFKKKIKALMKLNTNISLPAILYFRLFFSFARIKKQAPQLAKVNAVSKSISSPKIDILFNDLFGLMRIPNNL